MAKRAILFDLDGTLWRGYEWYSEILSIETGEDKGRILGELHKGRSVFVIGVELGLSRSRLLRLCRDNVGLLDTYPEVRETLAVLQGDGVSLGIVTNLSGRIAEPALSGIHLDRHFDVVVHPGNCGARKPSPQPILTGLSRLRVPVSEAISYVGDSANDAKCASSAGVPFVWASYGYSRHKPPNTDVILRDFRGVLKL